MENFEKVEKIREKTGVSYEDAKNVLEQNNYDMLEAIIALEREGKVNTPKDGTYYTGASQDMENVRKYELAQRQYAGSNQSNVKDGFKKIGDFFAKIFHKSLEIEFCINKDGEQKANVPLLVLIILVLGFFWITVPLIVIGLFFGFSYNFTGVDKVVVDVNDVCDKASQTAENIKNEFKKDEEENE